MYKICFLSWHFVTPKLFLDSILKMTPGHSGIWGNIKAITEIKKADFCIIMDGYFKNFPIERSIFVSGHPPNFSSYKSFDKYKGKAAAILPLSKNLNPGEWWVDYDYDYLVKLKPPQKTKNLICIMTYKDTHSTYRQRITFMDNYCNCSKLKTLDLYGRPETKFKMNNNFKSYYRGFLGINNPDVYTGEHIFGKNILINYRYSLEFDLGPTYNYITERFYDSLLLWCMPIYYGSNNVQEFFPENSFRYINIENLSEIFKIDEIVKSVFREQNIDSIRCARDLILNKYQIWPYIHNVINNINKYRE